MAAENRYKMSQERYDSIVEELYYLETVREKEVAEQIKEARSFGDLSENSEYDEAKTEQGKLYSKIAEFKVLIENADIISMSDHPSDVVTIGSVITVFEVDFDEEATFQLVGSQEANPVEGKISDESPIGRAILGQKEGAEVVYEAPMGKATIKILKIEQA